MRARARNRFGSRGAGATGGRRPRRDSRFALAEAARDDAVARRPAAPVPVDRERAAGRPDPLALQAGRQRYGGRGAALAARETDGTARRRDGLPERPLPASARPEPAADRRAGP